MHYLNPNNYLAIRIYNNENIELQIADTTGIYTNASVISDIWENYVLTYNKGIWTLYKNGILVNSGNYSGSIFFDTAVIGNTVDYNNGFGGRLDDVRIYNRALSADEVKKLYEWAPGPVAWWKFDEKSGTTAYDSAASTTYSGGNHGTTNDGANNTGMDCSKPGKYGTACDFDGIDDRIYFGDQPVFNFGKNSFSVLFWMKAEALPTGQFGYRGGLVSKMASSESSGWRIYYNGAVGIYARYDLTHFNEIETDDISTGSWHHIAMVTDRESGRIQIYKDGMIDNNTINISTWGDIDANDGYELLAGAVRSDLSYFHGLIDDVRIYNYARTQKQILEDMLGTSKPGGGDGAGAIKAPVLHLSSTKATAIRLMTLRFFIITAPFIRSGAPGRTIRSARCGTRAANSGERWSSMGRMII